MCEQKKGKLVGYKNRCAKKGDGPASQCGDKCNNKVRDGWMRVSAQEHLFCLAIVLLVLKCLWIPALISSILLQPVHCWEKKSRGDSCDAPP